MSKTDMFAHADRVLPLKINVLQTNTCVQRYKLSLSIYSWISFIFILVQQTNSLKSDYKKFGNPQYMSSLWILLV